MNVDPSSRPPPNSDKLPPENEKKLKVIIEHSPPVHPGHDITSLDFEVESPNDRIVSVGIDSSSESDSIELWYKQTIANMRKYGIENIDEDNIEDIQDFFSANYSSFLGSLTIAAQEKIGPPPTEFAIIGLGSLGRYEAGPYSDLDFAILIEEDTKESKDYFLNLATEMNKIVRSLDEGAEGISFCDGGLTPPFMQGKSTIQFGSSALLDTPESMAEWSLPTHSPENFNRRDNLANPATITNSMTFSQLMYGDQKLLAQMRSSTAILLQQKPDKDKSADYKKWRGGLNYGRLVGLELIKPKESLKKGSAEAMIKKGILSPIMNTVRGLCYYHGIDETNISEGINKLQRRGHLSPDLAIQLKRTYQAAYKKRLQLQMNAHDPSYHASDFTKEEKIEIEGVIKDLHQRSKAFIRSNGKSNPFL